MKSFVKALLLTAAMLAATGALAQRAPVPIIDHPNVPVVTSSGKPVPLVSLHQAIISGGAAGARKWDVVPNADGKSLRATYKVRAHTVMVDIVPSSSAFTVKYADSVNMKYEMYDGKPVIHPFYNRWVDELIDSIRAEIRKL
jgi:hypothetical protein